MQCIIYNAYVPYNVMYHMIPYMVLSYMSIQFNLFELVIVILDLIFMFNLVFMYTYNIYERTNDEMTNEKD